MQILQWIVAAGTAVFVATIGYFQWRTAQQKVVLELFDRRHEIYREIREAVARITGSGRADLDIEIKVAEALERARFFFGIEVIRYLEQFVEAVRDLNCYGQEATATQNAIEKSGALKKSREAKNKIERFREDAPALFAPYMRLDQKMPKGWPILRRL